GPGTGVRTTARSATGWTVVVVVTVLFKGLGSSVRLETVALFMIVPIAAAVGGTMMVTVTVALTFSVPMAAVTVPPDCAGGNPGPVAAETNVTPAGRTSVRVTPVASLGPRLVTVIVYTRFWFSCTGLGAARAVTARSVAGVTGVVTLIVLFDRLG